MNNGYSRQLARLACRIHSDCSANDIPVGDEALPVELWNRCRRELSLLRRAEQLRWSGAANRIRTRFDTTLSQLTDELQRVLRRARAHCVHCPASPREMYDDLVGLHDEFQRVDWNTRQFTLSVETAPIRLEGRYLGPFQIELQWRNHRQSSAYRVISLDPHPAAQDESTTHPHVQGEQLCEGEGSRPIAACLAAGRWFDFFLLVRSVLTTYNAESPFISLDRWDGTLCYDCDCGLSEEDAYRCCRCERYLCGECRRCCSACEESVCAGCARVCEVCEDDLCVSCAADCRRCERTCCASCLPENQNCDICHEECEENSTIGRSRSPNTAV